MEKTVDAVQPNAGVAAAYRKRLDREIAEMQASLTYWILAKYRAAPPALAQDASPAAQLRALCRKLARRWQRNFDVLAPELAQRFSDAAASTSDAAYAAALRKAGVTVRFKPTRTQNDVLQASIGENVDLIRSIASQHLTQVQGAVMRAVQAGGDMASLSVELQKTYGVTKRRAAFIARDQTNKATAAFTRVRQQELGVTEAIWMHSAGGKEPRPSHVAFSGKRYQIAKGAFLEGKWVWPGTEPNCRCVSKSVVPGFGD